jgi:DNA polymerase-3 subunit gamma/tau
MSYLVLARKYRPQTFTDVVAQGHITETLGNAIDAGRVAHAILFTGPRGTGKTTVARILAKAMNCQGGPTPSPCNQCRSCSEITAGHSVDVLEIDGASNNGVEQIRELRDNVKYMPAYSPHKIYIIDEVHMLSTPAFNALLKTLEEPPAHVLFMLATTEPHKIPATIHSRCQRFDFRRIRLDAVSSHLGRICGQEGVELAGESLDAIARESGGSIRDSLSLLDQVISSGRGAVTHEQVLDLLGVVDRRQLHALADALLARDADLFLGVLDEVFDRGHDIKRLYAGFLEHFRNLMVVLKSRAPEPVVDLPAPEIELLRRQAAQTSPAAVHQVLETLFHDEAAVRLSPQPKLAMEMVFFKIVQTPPALAIDALIEKLDGLRREVGQAPGRNEPPAAGTPPGTPSAPSGRPSPEARGRSAAGGDPGWDEAQGREPAAGVGLDPAVLPEQCWEKITERIGRSQPSLAASLRRCRLHVAGAGRVEVITPPNHFSAGMLRREKNMALLNQVCAEVLGGEPQVVLVGEADSPPNAHEKRQRHQELVNQTLNDPLVDEAIQIFNGRLVEVQIIQEVPE